MLSPKATYGQSHPAKDNLKIVNNFQVRWHKNSRNDNIGEVLEIYKRVASQRSKSAITRWRRIYTYITPNYLEDVTAWTSPTRKKGKITGVILSTAFGTGSGKEVVILAKIGGQFRPVFKRFSNKTGGKNPLRMLPVTKDQVPEIIFTTDYELPVQKETWKWSDRMKRYIRSQHSTNHR